MYLLVKGRGIIKVPDTSAIKRILCMHKEVVSGTHCSENGLMRISGMDKYEVCTKCGKILDESHTIY